MNIDNYVMSRFNILFREETRCFIYNSLSGGLHEIDEESFNTCLAYQNAKQIKYTPNAIFGNLFKKSYIVPKGKDDEEIKLMHYFKLRQNFQQDRLTMIIAPTLFCNFSCPYCYEKDLPYTQMSENVINGIIDFIKQREKDFKHLEICWHGGEPLCGLSIIEKILSRIDKEISLPISSQTMVSNGYLIDERFTSLFSQHKLDYLQITIDGKKENHNKNRVSKNGLPTFDKIINNIKYALKELSNVNIGIRMNVHKGNMMDFVPLYQELTKLFNNNRVHIYSAFVQDNQACRVSCFNSVEKTNYLYNLYKLIGLNLSTTNFELKLGKCTAIYEHSYIVDPSGDLYKCWVDVGVKAYSIGTVFDGVQNYRLNEKYLLSSDKFSDKKCLSCCIFPICNGGCNKYRFDKDYKTEDICPLSADMIVKFLKEKISK